MVAKSLYPDGVEIHSIDLTRESAAKDAAILNRNVDTSIMGAVSGGFTVSPTYAANSTVTVSSPGGGTLASVGYAPSGERISLYGTVTVSLVDIVLGHLNYVCIMYREARANPEPHETLAQVFNTSSTPPTQLVSNDIVVVTPADYANWPATASPALDGYPDYTSNTKDRALIIAVVTGNGNTTVQLADIESYTSYAKILSASAPATITGVMMGHVDPTTPVGTGSLIYTPGASPYLEWAINGGSGGGTYLYGDNLYELTASGGFKLDVIVTMSLLPQVTLTDTITITSIYDSITPTFSANDITHRHMLGSGTPTINNPHGVSLRDITNASLDGILGDHQELLHAAGIIKNSADSQPGRTLLIVRANNTDAVHGATVAGLNSSLNDKFVVNGNTFSNIHGAVAGDGNYAVPFAAADLPSNEMVQLYGIYAAPDGTVTRGSSPRVSMSYMFGRAGDPFLGYAQVVDISDNWQPDGFAVVYLTYSSTMFYLSDPDSFASSRPVAKPTSSGIIRLYMPDGSRWLDAYIDSTHIFAEGGQPQVTVYPNMDPNKYLLLGYIVCQGTTGPSVPPVMGFSDVGGGGGGVINRRSFGNMNEKQISQSTIYNLSQRSVNELRESGVVSGLDIVATGGGSVAVGGGIAYVDGVRCEIQGSTSVVLPSAGIYIINMSPLSSGHHHEMGYPAALSAIQYVAEVAPPGLNLWLVVSDGNVLTQQYRIARNISHLDGQLPICVDSAGGGAFTTITDAVAYINQRRNASLPVSSDIVVRGVITNPTTVTVPTGVTIRGSATITAPATGSTVFSCLPGVKIEDLTIYLNAGITGIVVASDCKISNCSIISSSGQAGLNGIAVGSGGAGQYRIVIDKCHFKDLVTGVFNVDPTTLDMNDFTVTNCQFTATVDQLSIRFISLGSSCKPIITNNRFYVSTPIVMPGLPGPTLTNPVTAIYGVNVQEAIISNNTMKDFAPLPSALVQHCFFMVPTGAARVFDVTIDGNITSGIVKLAHILCNTASNQVIISNNQYGMLAVSYAVNVGAIEFGSGAIYELNITGNLFIYPPAACIITREVATGVNISNNSCRSNSPAANGYASAVFYLHQSWSTSNYASWTVNDNNISSVYGVMTIADTYATATYAAGIVILGYGSITCVGNNISDIGSNGGPVNACGILVGAQYNSSNYPSNINISNNNISTIGKQSSGGSVVNAFGIGVFNARHVNVADNNMSNIFTHTYVHEYVPAATIQHGVYLKGSVEVNVGSCTFDTCQGVLVTPTYTVVDGVQVITGDIFINNCVFSGSVNVCIYFTTIGRNVSITGNESFGYGHGTFAAFDGSVYDIHVSDNSACGGRTFIFNGEVTGAVFSHNIFDTAGRMIEFNGNTQDIMIDGNVAKNIAGGIFFTNAFDISNVTISNNIFDIVSGCAADAYGKITTLANVVTTSGVANISNVTISNNNMIRIGATAISIDARVKNINITGNNVDGCTAFAAFIGSEVHNVIFSNNNIVASTALSISSAVTQFTTSMVSNNEFYLYHSGAGIAIASLATLNVTIASNKFSVGAANYVTDGCGISIGGDAGRTIISDNTFYGMAYAAISLLSCTTVKVINNVIDNCGIYSSTKVGLINIVGAVSVLDISGNQFNNNNTNDYVPIYLSGANTVVSLNINNNMVDNHSPTSGGIRLVNVGTDATPGRGVIISGNNINFGNTHSAIEITGHIDNLMINNNMLTSDWAAAGGSHRCIYYYNTDTNAGAMSLATIISNNVCYMNNSNNGCIFIGSAVPTTVGMNGLTIMGNNMRRWYGLNTMSDVLIACYVRDQVTAANVIRNPAGSGNTVWLSQSYNDNGNNGDVINLDASLNRSSAADV